MPRRVRTGERYLLAPGEWLPGKDRYQIEGSVGEGAFAAAYKARNERGEVCFVKEYFPADRPSKVPELNRVYGTERDVVRRIGNYELIPRFWDAFEHEGYSYLVTDFIPGPDLEEVLKSGQKPSGDVLVRWCVCLCHELSFLHSRNVIHHDLKPANIRLNEEGDPVLVDFSAAHWFRKAGETTDQLYGSDSYLAPEYSERSSEDLDAGQKMDVFAMGRIFVELMVGERLSQDDIDRRQDQFYGQILQNGKLDVSFVRAVFKSVAYDPTRRYDSGIALAEDITPAAPPLGRVRPTHVDFGQVSDAAPRELVVQAYNVGGGTLHCEIASEADWLEVGTTGAATGKAAMFERNRQAVRLIAHPEKVPMGAEAVARVVFTFQKNVHEMQVRLRRATTSVEVSVNTDTLKINVPPGGFGQGKLTFNNSGATPATVRLIPPANLTLGLQPEEFALAPRSKQEVTVAIDASALGESGGAAELGWTASGNPQPAVKIQAAIKSGGGLLSGLFKKKK